jgi:hypothetical protein
VGINQLFCGHLIRHRGLFYIGKRGISGGNRGSTSTHTVYSKLAFSTISPFSHQYLSFSSIINRTIYRGMYDRNPCYVYISYFITLLIFPLFYPASTQYSHYNSTNPYSPNTSHDTHLSSSYSHSHNIHSNSPQTHSHQRSISHLHYV